MNYPDTEQLRAVFKRLAVKSHPQVLRLVVALIQRQLASAEKNIDSSARHHYGAPSAVRDSVAVVASFVRGEIKRGQALQKMKELHRWTVEHHRGNLAQALRTAYNRVRSKGSAKLAGWEAAHQLHEAALQLCMAFAEGAQLDRHYLLFAAEDAIRAIHYLTWHRLVPARSKNATWHPQGGNTIIIRFYGPDPAEEGYKEAQKQCNKLVKQLAALVKTPTKRSAPFAGGKVKRLARTIKRAVKAPFKKAMANLEKVPVHYFHPGGSVA